MSSLQFGQLTTMMYQCEGTADSLGLLEKKKQDTIEMTRHVAVSEESSQTLSLSLPRAVNPRSTLELVIGHGVFTEQINKTCHWASCSPKFGVTESLQCQ